MVALRNQAGSKRMGQLCLLHRGRRRKPLAAAGTDPHCGFCSETSHEASVTLARALFPSLYFLPTLPFGVGGLLFAPLPTPGVGCESWGSALIAPLFCWVFREREPGK